MAAPSLSDFEALTFDVYGTLIDWESGMIEGLKPLTDRLDHELDRNAILQAHAYHESTAQRWTPAKRYRELLPAVYRRLAEEWGIAVTWDECLTYGRSVDHWPAFPDSADALQELKRHYKLFVLTNTDNESFSHANAKLGAPFDGIYTAEDIGSYKPDPRNFKYMLQMLKRLGIDKSKVLHVAESLFHDHEQANAFGLANCWIYRRHDQEGFGATMTPGVTPTTTFRFDSMADLVSVHRFDSSG